MSRAVSRGEPAPVYWFHGEETFLMDREAKRMEGALVAADFRDFNLNLFYGNECRGEDIVEAAQTLPFFASRRLVVVRRAELLAAASLEKVAEYLRNPATSTCLLFIGGKIDGRKKIFAELKKSGALVEFKRPYDNRLPSFVAEEAARLGKKLEPAATELLLHMVGNNLRELVSQLEKVATFAGEAPVITREAVREVACDSRVDTVFDLTDALGDREAAQALRSLRILLREGDAPLQILHMITRHYRQLWKISEAVEKRVPQQDLPGKV
ncbi:MAG TPA: DNA polymerase III subunit delta, partial [Verrucomicrobiae bacterium]|nr:DNA polymerase III subunit delta [Verrucomicrobiae bacterium]